MNGWGTALYLGWGNKSVVGGANALNIGWAAVLNAGWANTGSGIELYVGNPSSGSSGIVWASMGWN